MAAEQQAIAATLRAQLAAVTRIARASVERSIRMAEAHAVRDPSVRKRLRRAVRNLRRMMGAPQSAEPCFCPLLSLHDQNTNVTRRARLMSANPRSPEGA